MAGKKGKKQPKIENKEAVFKAICDFYAENDCTIVNACKVHEIAYTTFYNIRNGNAELESYYNAAVDKTKAVFKERLKAKAKNSLEKLVEGGEVIETQETITFQKNEKGELVEVVEKIVRTKKTFLPSLGAVTFALKNTNGDLNNDVFYDVQKMEHSGKIENDGTPVVSVLGLKELLNIANNLPENEK